MTSPSYDNPLWGSDWKEVRSLWPLDPEIAHLNHGSFGAVPSAVMAAQDQWRRRMESHPTGFFWWVLPEALDQARRSTAAFLGGDPAGFVFVPNATTAVNTVLHSISLRPGDQVLLSDHGYGAVRLAAERACLKAGAEVVVRSIAFPKDDLAELAGDFMRGVTERTRLAVVDHIASPTALVFPVKEIIARLRDAGVLSLVDAAHAPGMVDVDLGSLGADFWTGNFHKWCCAPVGSAGMFVAEAHRDIIAPLVTSWNSPDGFVASFGYLGTDDYTSYLTVPASIEFMRSLGWDRVRAHNRALARLGRDLLCEALGTGRPADVEGAFEAMTLVPLPETSIETLDQGKEISRQLAERHHIEAAVFPWNGRGFLRLSAQAYNAPGDYERLAVALPEILRG